jgi:hypothetical protein
VGFLKKHFKGRRAYMNLTIIFWMTLGAFVCAITANIIEHVQSARGVLRIDHSNPQKDLYLFEIDEIEKLNKKKCVILKIDHKANLSQK